MVMVTVVPSRVVTTLTVVRRYLEATWNQRNNVKTTNNPTAYLCADADGQVDIDVMPENDAETIQPDEPKTNPDRLVKKRRTPRAKRPAPKSSIHRPRLLTGVDQRRSHGSFLPN